MSQNLRSVANLKTCYLSPCSHLFSKSQLTVAHVRVSPSMVLITLSVSEHLWQVKECRTFTGMIRVAYIATLRLKPVSVSLSVWNFSHILAPDLTLASAVTVSRLTGWPTTWPLPLFTYLWAMCHCRSPKLIFNPREIYPPTPHEMTTPNTSGPPHCPGFTITLTYAAISKRPLDEW